MPLIGELIPELDRQTEDWELLFVDDGSRDGGFELIRSLHQKDPRISGIRLSENRGQQNAVYCGICHSRGRWVVTMDDDLQHPPALIGNLIREIAEGGDLIYGIPEEKSSSFSQRAGQALRNGFFRLFLGKPRGVALSSYRIFSGDLARRIAGVEGQFVYVSALLFRLDPQPEARTITYSLPASLPKMPSRFTPGARLALFARLFRYYGPFRGLIRKGGTPYEIGEVL